LLLGDSANSEGRCKRGSADAKVDDGCRWGEGRNLRTWHDVLSLFIINSQQVGGGMRLSLHEKNGVEFLEW